MKTVISASRRTDIPAYYLDWFMDVLRRGSVNVANPVFRHKTIQVDLSPETVEWIVFWSRNYAHFLKEYPFFDQFQLYFHFTILSHHPRLERTALPLTQALRQIEHLTKLYGPQRIIWRYDPIVIWIDNNELCSNFRQNEFADLCKNMSLSGIQRCYFSFAGIYRKYQRRIKKKYPTWQLNDARIEAEKARILLNIKEISNKYAVKLYACCNDALINGDILKGRCISGPELNNLGSAHKVSEAKAPSRPECGCTRSIDIGDYLNHPCYGGCIYCYANPVWDTPKFKHPDT